MDTERVASAGREDGDRSNAPPEAIADPATGLARANLYRYMAAAVQSPREEGFDRILDPAFQRACRRAAAWLRRDPAFRPDGLGPGEVDPGSLTTELPFPDADDAEAEYVATFGHSISKDCPPYEVEYCPNRDITYRSQKMADVAGFYRAFGLGRDDGARERIDHLAFQAEFMEVVIARQLYAAEHDLGDERIRVCRAAQREFFVDHLGWWLPAFGIALEERRPVGFYGRLGRWIRAFVAIERTVLAVPPFTEMPSARPQEWQALDGCGTCPGPADLQVPDDPRPAADR